MHQEKIKKQDIVCLKENIPSSSLVYWTKGIVHKVDDQYGETLVEALEPESAKNKRFYEYTENLKLFNND